MRNLDYFSEHLIKSFSIEYFFRIIQFFQNSWLLSFIQQLLILLSFIFVYMKQNYFIASYNSSNLMQLIFKFLSETTNSIRDLKMCNQSTEQISTNFMRTKQFIHSFSFVIDLLVFHCLFVFNIFESIFVKKGYFDEIIY